MSEDLGDAKLALSTDQTELDRGLDAGEAKTRSFLDRVGGATKTAYKAVAVAVATGLAAATGQGLQLNQVLSDVQSQTGATGDDWEAMEAVIRRENGRTTESMDAIGGATKAMREDLNLAGPDITKYADRFFDAGNVTKTSAETMVKATDDIGDAFGTNIDRSLDSIDQIIAGQKRWGGDLQARIAILPTLAKGLKGLNGTLDDGISLLNVASSTGLDYAEVQKAINAAVSKFKVPPALKDVIGLQDLHKTKVQLANEEVQKLEDTLAQFVVPDRLREIVKTLDGIEDPTQRAAAAEKIYNDEVAAFNADPIQRYLDILGAIPDDQARVQRGIELFGPKAGPVWATLVAKVHEAGGNLDSFNVAQAEATGEAQRVGAALDKGPLRSLKLIGESLGGLLADAGSNPLVTGVASLGTILGGFAPNLSGKIAGGILTAVKGAWVKVAATSAVQAVVGVAADKAATAYLKALFAGDAVEGALRGVWARIAATSVGQAMIAGTAAGSAFRTAASAAIVGLVAIVTVKLVFDYVDAQKQNVDLINQITEDSGAASVEALQGMRERLAAALATEQARFDPFEDFFGLSQQNNLQDQLNALDGLIAAKTADLGKTASQLGPAINDGLERGMSQIDPAAIAAPMGVPVAAAVSRIVSSSIGNMGANWTVVAKMQANRAAAALASTIYGARDTVDQAWQALLDGIGKETTPTEERAKLLGRLASTALIHGLRSKDPALHDQAEATKQAILDRLAELEPNSKNIGKKGMAALQKAMKSKDADIRNAALAIYNAATHKLSTVPGVMTGYGHSAGAAYAAGLRATYGLVNDAANYVARGAVGPFKASSPPGPESPLHFIDVWGARTGQAWIQPFAAAIVKGKASLVDAIAGVGNAVSTRRFPALVPSIMPRQFALAGAGTAPTLTPDVLPVSRETSAGAAAAPGGDTYHVHLLDKMEARSVRDIGAGLRMLGERGHLVRKRKDLDDDR